MTMTVALNPPKDVAILIYPYLTCRFILTLSRSNSQDEKKQQQQ